MSIPSNEEIAKKIRCVSSKVSSEPEFRSVWFDADDQILVATNGAALIAVPAPENIPQWKMSYPNGDIAGDKPRYNLRSALPAANTLIEKTAINVAELLKGLRPLSKSKDGFGRIPVNFIFPSGREVLADAVFVMLVLRALRDTGSKVVEVSCRETNDLLYFGSPNKSLALVMGLRSTAVAAIDIAQYAPKAV